MIGPIAAAREAAIRRRAMKRWLRARGYTIPTEAMYQESALRRLVKRASS